MKPPRPQSEPENTPPSLGPVPIFALTLVSVGFFLYIWSLMWAHYIRTAKPDSKVGPLTWINCIPGALFYINLPSLLLATRAGDATEIARLHIAMVLWGSIAAVSLVATGIAIFIAQRQIGMPTRHKP